ncbi:MAG: hypothetical protein SFU53_05640 [Terrimicrobiaceae bacterium]|nr:hypothetical protein [Terrimicrobiaceae bacterium]
MNDSQSWASLPESIKRQAAPDMLRGERWFHFGRPVQHPGTAELAKWAGTAPASVTPPAPQKPAGEAASARTPRVRRQSQPARMTCREKREAADNAIRSHPDKGNRELARLAGVTHPFIAKRRRFMLRSVD